jgi:hypothetical protein
MKETVWHISERRNDVGASGKGMTGTVRWGRHVHVLSSQFAGGVIHNSDTQLVAAQDWVRMQRGRRTGVRYADAWVTTDKVRGLRRDAQKDGGT